MWDEEWHQYKRKDGKLGHWYSVPGPEYSQLNTCELCGRIGVSKKVQIRNDVYGWNLQHDNRGYVIGEGKSKSMLCMGCWNKVRPLAYAFDTIVENRRILNKLKRDMANERKNQNNRGNA
jgi:hypothetical protein